MTPQHAAERLAQQADVCVVGEGVVVAAVVDADVVGRRGDDEVDGGWLQELGQLPRVAANDDDRAEVTGLAQRPVGDGGIRWSGEQESAASGRRQVSRDFAASSCSGARLLTH